MSSRRRAEVDAFVEVADHARRLEACLRAGMPAELVSQYQPAEDALRRRHGDAIVDEVLRRREEIAAAYAPLEALRAPDGEDDE